MPRGNGAGDHKESRLVVGLISGTSVDAIDAALARIADRADGTRRVELLAARETPFPPALRAAVFALFPPRRGSVAAVAELDALLGEAFAAAALDLLREAGIAPEEVDLISSHGQTIYHAPRPAMGQRGRPTTPVTVQIGSGAVIAARTGITTVYDFRAADLARGGEGAPLTPYADFLLFGDARSLAVQNIGGIGNVTVIARGRGADGISAFDTGPGNMVIDAMAAHATDGRATYDLDGMIAATGAVSEALLDELLAHPFFALPPPKSTGREDFGTAYANHFRQRGEALGLTGPDLVATATALTARSIADAYRRFVLPHVPVEAVALAGGGARNPALRRMLAAELAPLPVRTLDEFGVSGDAREAVAFALLGYETAFGRPGSLPGITGVREPAILGAIAPGRGFRLWDGSYPSRARSRS